MNSIFKKIFLCIAVSLSTYPSLHAQTTYFSDDFETGVSKWSNTGKDWDTTSITSRTGKTCITNDPVSQYYPTNANEAITTANKIDLTGAATPYLAFWHKYALEFHQDNRGAWYSDLAIVEISTDNGFTWVQEKIYSAYQSTWGYEQIDLAKYNGRQIKVRFRLQSDGSGVDHGWYVDDVVIKEPDKKTLSLPFKETFENSLGNWERSGKDWDTTAADKQAGRLCITESPNGNYATNANNAIAMANPIDLTGAGNPVFTFWHKYALESHQDSAGTWNYDYARVEISTDNGLTWSKEKEYTQTLSTWSYEQIDLKKYIGRQIKVRFRFQSDAVGVSDGWFVDDVGIIVDNKISVTSPVGSEKYLVGSMKNITWTSTLVGNVKLEYSADNGGNWQTISASRPAVPGSYTWMVPNIQSSDCKVRITDVNNPSITGMSENAFAITIIPAPTLSSPLNNEVNQLTAVVLSWNASADADKYRLQVSIDQNFSALVFDDSTLTAPSKLIVGLSNKSQYYWRVSARNAGGSSVYSTVWSFTTIIGTPIPTSPVNNTVNQPLTLALIWSGVSGAESFHVQVSTDPNFGSFILNDSTVTATSKQLAGLTNGTKYYWRVNAKNNGASTVYSTVVNFVTIVAPSSAPVLSAPVNNATNQPTTLALSWTAAAGAESYRLQVSTDQNFSTLIVDDSTLTTTAKQVTGLSSYVKYFWKVNAKNAGGVSTNSVVWNFTTTMAQPVLSSPANNAVNQPVSLPLNWSVVMGADTYRLQVSVDQNFGSLIVDDSTLTAATKQVSGLINSTKYYWRVNAKNVSAVSNYSPVWNFTTIMALPTVPVLISPVNNAGNQAPILTVSWSGVAGAENYRLQVSTDLNFGALMFDDSTLTVTTKQLSGLSSSKNYYWRVNARNLVGSSAYSTVWMFSTVLDRPEKVTLVGPASGGNMGTDSVRFVWRKAIPAVSSYQVELTGDSTIVKVVSDTTITLKIPAMKNEKAFAWRVKAINASGSGLFSDVWAFVRLATSVAQFGSLPKDFAVNNYPNPFNPSTTFSFSLPSHSFVTLKVFNAIGREVALVVSQELSAGSYSRQWSADGLPSGMYFYRLQAGSLTETKRLLLLR